MKEFDTIAAIATGIGEGGISIIRISGDKALSVVCGIFQGKNGRELNDIRSYSMRYGYIIDRDSNERLDEVIVSYMKAPKSYTCEDIVEVNCHGGIVPANRILKELVKQGIRIAEPGEFTKRAFLNGRIDLSQAEAVIDIIRSKTDLSMKNAFLQSQGRLSKEIVEIRNNLLKLIAHIEATVDFPEDDIEIITGEIINSQLIDIKIKIDSLLKTAEQGKIIREGISTVIVGKPNVGKSSLLNYLLKENRAIVTDVPGTTRDVIEEYINIGGIPIRIVDTAGIRETSDLVEKIGVEKSKEKILQADLIIFMLDISAGFGKEDRDIIEIIKDKKYIVLLNKSDIGGKIDRCELEKLNSEFIIETSIITGAGIEKLSNCIKDMFFSGYIDFNSVMISNARHTEALIRACNSVKDAIDVMNSTYAMDLASIDIRNAWSYLGEITGETMQEDIIDKIFSEFCIGK